MPRIFALLAMLLVVGCDALPLTPPQVRPFDPAKEPVRGIFTLQVPDGVWFTRCGDSDNSYILDEAVEGALRDLHPALISQIDYSKGKDWAAVYLEVHGTLTDFDQMAEGQARVYRSQYGYEHEGVVFVSKIRRMQPSEVISC